MVICLERGVDLHMAQMMPLPLTISCFSKIQIVAAFLVPAHPGSPRQRAIKRRCVCVFDSTPTSPPLKLWLYGATQIRLLLLLLYYNTDVQYLAVGPPLWLAHSMSTHCQTIFETQHIIWTVSVIIRKPFFSHSTCMNSIQGTVQLHTIQIHYWLRHGQLGPDKLFIYLFITPKGSTPHVTITNTEKHQKHTRSTCPHYCSPICCNTNVMSSIPSLSLRSPPENLSPSLMPHIDPTKTSETKS